MDGCVLDVSAAMSWQLLWDGDPAQGQRGSRCVLMRPVPLQHSHYAWYPDVEVHVPPVLDFNVKMGVNVRTVTNSCLSLPFRRHCHSHFHLFHHLHSQSFTTCSTSWCNVICWSLECLSDFVFTPFFPPSPAQSPTLCFSFLCLFLSLWWC